MIFQITDYGVSVLNTTHTPPQFDSFQLGDGHNYIPQATDTAIHGSLVFSGSVSQPELVNANVVKYAVYLDYTVGDFEFGEVGFIYQGQLFGLGDSADLISKIATGSELGNSIRLDIYLSMVGTNYSMWFDLAESNNAFRIASLASPDVLPPSADAVPNVYIVRASSSSQEPILAYTDQTGLWNFDCYRFQSVNPNAALVGFDSHSITINATDFSSDMVPDFFGDIILEFTTGALYSICRYVKTAVVSGATATLGFDTLMAQMPAVGDKFKIFKRAQTSVDLILPVATSANLGAIKIGSGLVVLPDGTCSVDLSGLTIVTAVNGQTGSVIVNAANLSGLSAVGKSGNYSDLIGAPSPYLLPAMSTTVRGGAKAPSNGNLVISGDVIDLGFNPVKKVNNIVPDVNGNVTVPTNLVPATNSTLGGIKIGSGLAVTGDGTTSVDANSIQFATTATKGVVQVGQGLKVAIGVISSSLLTVNGVGPDSGGNVAVTATITPATTSTLGGVKISSGLLVASDGTLTVDNSSLQAATISSRGVVQIGSGIKVSAGVISSAILTVGGASPDAGGNIVVPADASKLDRISGIATGIQLTFLDKGAVSSTVNFALTAGNVQAASFSAGSVTWTLSAWPATGVYAELQLELTNAGLATHTFPAAVNWVNPDGTFTTSFATYMGNQRAGATNFQSSGKDFVIFWTRSGGTTVYGRVL